MLESMLQGAVGMELGLVLLEQITSRKITSQLFIAGTDSDDTDLRLAGSANTSFFCYITYLWLKNLMMA